MATPDTPGRTAVRPYRLADWQSGVWSSDLVLDLAGAWDPTLAFVMGEAVAVTLVAFRFVLRQPAPLLGGKFYLPTRSDIDRPLILGAVLFGVGWGLGGYCPGPAIAAVGLGSLNPLLFLAAMVAGSLAFKALNR